MSANEKKNKDKAMAAYLKKRGITRNTTQCPFHFGPVPLSTLSAHLQTCRARLGRRSYGHARH